MIIVILLVYIYLFEMFIIYSKKGNKINTTNSFMKTWESLWKGILSWQVTKQLKREDIKAKNHDKW